MPGGRRDPISSLGPWDSEPGLPSNLHCAFFWNRHSNTADYYNWGPLLRPQEGEAGSWRGVAEATGREERMQQPGAKCTSE